jgi:hypothetical protein
MSIERTVTLSPNPWTFTARMRRAAVESGRTFASARAAAQNTRRRALAHRGQGRTSGLSYQAQFALSRRRNRDWSESEFNEVKQERLQDIREGWLLFSLRPSDLLIADGSRLRNSLTPKSFFPFRYSFA